MQVPSDKVENDYMFLTVPPLRPHQQMRFAVLFPFICALQPFRALSGWNHRNRSGPDFTCELEIIKRIREDFCVTPEEDDLRRELIRMR